MAIVLLSVSEKQAVAPTGRLRIAVAVGPAASATWSVRNPATGNAEGIAVDLGKDVADRIGIPADVVDYSSSGAIVSDAASGNWDITFIPADEERKKHVLFGPNYFLGESTYLVHAASCIREIADIDRPGVRVLGIDNTATLRSAVRSLVLASASGVKQLDEAIRMFRKGEVDALALGRESLQSLLPDLPGAVILDGSFHKAGTALAVPLERTQAIMIAGNVLEDAKRDGTVRRIFDRHGLAAAVAPEGSRP